MLQTNGLHYEPLSTTDCENGNFGDSIHDDYLLLSSICLNRGLPAVIVPNDETLFFRLIFCCVRGFYKPTVAK